MALIGLTGGIASGKSTIAARLAELGAHVIDADQLAREVVEPGSATLAAIAKEFGAELLLADGSLNREALGQRVFPNPELLQTLNSLIHPAIGALAKSKISAALRADPQGIVVYDVPLLVESSNQKEDWDLIVVADAPSDLRFTRLVEIRGLDEADARARIDRQASDEERRRVADVLIDTSGSLTYTIEQVDSLWADLPTRLKAADAELGE